MEQQPQDNPIIIIADDDTALLEAEREKNRILRVAIESIDNTIK